MILYDSKIFDINDKLTGSQLLFSRNSSFARWFKECKYLKAIFFVKLSNYKENIKKALAIQTKDL